MEQRDFGSTLARTRAAGTHCLELIAPMCVRPAHIHTSIHKYICMDMVCMCGDEHRVASRLVCAPQIAGLVGRAPVPATSLLAPMGASLAG